MLGWLISSMIRRSMNALELPNQGSESGAADNTRGIFDAFLEGVDGGARYESAGAAGLREQRVPWNRRQFYWEGFALGASARQALNPFSRGGPQRRYSAPGYWFMFYTGVGFYNGAAEQRYLPRIPVDADSFAGSPDFMMGRPLIAGGISFAHIASNVKWDPALVRHLLIEGDEDWNRGVWMGCGRGLWFLYMREFDQLERVLDELDEELAGPVTMGLGLAITYTQIAEAGRIAEDIERLHTRHHAALIAGSRLCLGAALEDDPRLVDWRAGLDEPLATWAREGAGVLAGLDRSRPCSEQLLQGLFVEPSGRLHSSLSSAEA